MLFTIWYARLFLSIFLLDSATPNIHDSAWYTLLDSDSHTPWLVSIKKKAWALKGKCNGTRTALRRPPFYFNIRCCFSKQPFSFIFYCFSLLTPSSQTKKIPFSSSLLSYFVFAYSWRRVFSVVGSSAGLKCKGHPALAPWSTGTRSICHHAWLHLTFIRMVPVLLLKLCSFSHSGTCLWSRHLGGSGR